MLYSTTTSEKSPRKLPKSVKVGKFAAWKMAWCKNWHFRECDGIKIELGHDLYFMHYGHVWRVGQTCMECLHCTKPVYWGGSVLKSASQSFFLCREYRTPHGRLFVLLPGWVAKHVDQIVSCIYNVLYLFIKLFDNFEMSISLYYYCDMSWSTWDIKLFWVFWNFVVKCI